MSGPTFEQVEALYQAFLGQHILICRNLAFHHGPMQFCNVTDRCVHYPSPLDQKACLTASMNCNVKYVGITPHNNSLPYRMEFYFTSPLL